MPYSRFRFKAVVDWIELEIQTVKATNFQTLRRGSGVNFVESQDAGGGGAAKVFRFRIQDPGRWSDVEDVLSRLPPLAIAPKVTGIEIALDAYSEDSSRERLAELAAHFAKYNTAPASTNRRFSGRWKGDVEPFRHIAGNTRKLQAGRVINVGNKGDPRSQRIYVKTTDNNAQPLPDSGCRARFENTFQGAGLTANRLPTLLHDWGCFRFESLSAFYAFRTLKDGLDPIVAVAMEAHPQVGERKKINRKEGGTRLHPKPTRADSLLNELARDALRKLSLRWKRGPKRSGETQTANALTCGNTGTLNPEDPDEHGKSDAGSNNYTYSNSYPHSTSPQTTEEGGGAVIAFPTPEAVSRSNYKVEHSEEVLKVGEEKIVCTPVH